MTLKDLNQEKDEESLKKHTDEIDLNEKHLSLIYDTLSDVIFLLAVEPDDCFRFVSVNQAFLAVTGLTREQVVGKRIEQVLPETAHVLVISKYKEAMVGNKTVFWEEVSSYPTGELVGAVTVTPVWTVEGVCTHLVGTVHDLTERKRAEEALRESEEKYNSLFFEMIDGFALHEIICDSNGKPIDYVTLDVNKSYEKMMGVKKEAVVGIKASQFMTAKELNEWLELFGPAALNGKSTHYVKYSPVNNEYFEGVVYCPKKNQFAVTFTNITMRKQAETALRESEARFKNIFSKAPTAIEYYDSEGSLIDVNQECLNIFGVEDIKELKGFKLFEDPNLSEEAKRQVKEGKPYKYETEFDFELVKEHKLYKTSKSGKCFLNILITPYEISELDEVGYLVHVVDITERKQAEEVLRERETLLKETGRTAKVGGWEVDTKTLEVNWTEETYRIHEVPLNHKPTLQEAINFFHPDDRPKLETAIQKALEHGKPYDMELRFITAKGKHLWTHTICKPIIVDGKTVKLTGVFQDITKPKQAEQSLQEAEAELKHTIEVVPGIIIKANGHTGYFTYCNTTLSSILGFSLEEFLARPLIEFIHPDDRQSTINEVENQLKGSPVARFENRYICKNGSYKWFEWGARAADEKGIIYAAASDITERKQAEKMLQRSEALLNATQQLSKIGGWEWDVETQTMFWTDEVYRIHDFQPNQFAPGSIEHIEQSIECYDPEDRPVIMEAFKNCAENGQAYNLEFPFTTSMGRKRWIRTVANPVLKDKRIVKVIGNIIDITECKQAEDELKASQLKYKQLFETMTSGVAIYEVVDDGNDFIFRDFNQAGENIEKVKREDVIGRRVTEAFPGVSEFGLFKVFQRVWRTGKPEYFPEAIYRDERDPGTWRESWVYKLPSGEIVSVYNNITERKQAEVKFQKLNEELEQRITERTAELEENNKELESMNKVFVGRELRMAELKKQIAELEKNSEADKNSGDGTT